MTKIAPPIEACKDCIFHKGGQSDYEWFYRCRKAQRALTFKNVAEKYPDWCPLPDAPTPTAEGGTPDGV